MTDKELAAIRARVDAASPGPWRVSMSGACVKVDEGGRVVDLPQYRLLTQVEALGMQAAADLEFIADARTDMPRLLDEIERLRVLVAHVTDY